MLTVIPVVSRLSSRVIRILGCNPGPMTLQGTNTYLIGTGQRRILLDTGDKDRSEYIGALSKVLQDEGARVDKILLSHWHHDHVGGVPSIYGQNHLCEKDCTVHKIPRNDIDCEDYGVELAHLLDGQEIITEGATLKVIYTPGHTVDHAAFWLSEEKSLFTGDCVLGEGTTVLETLSDYMRSLHLMRDLNATVLYPGHGTHVTDARSHISNYITHREKRENQILECLRNTKDNAGVTESFIVGEVYKGLPENLVLPATMNVNQHLIKLEEENLVVKDPDGKWKFVLLSGKL